MAVDALQMLANAVEKQPRKKVFYTDEYKSDPSSRRFAPFFKPDFDPVLIMNCCYPTHLMAMNVSFLKDIGAYEDDRATWCHDWDTLTRAMAAGEEPVHVRALTYAWRINPGSTASAETGTKPGTVASQRFVLDRLLQQRGLSPTVRVEPNTIETSSGMWRVVTDKPVENVVILDAASIWGSEGLGFAGLRSALKQRDVAWIAILTKVDNMQGLLALSGVARLDDRVRAVSGLVLDGKSGALRWSGGLFASGGIILDPYAGRQMSEGGYHGQLWCQRCVDVAAPINVLIRADSLYEALEVLDEEAGPDGLMTTLGVLAQEAGAFIAVTPHLLWADELRNMFPIPNDRRGALVGDVRLVNGGRWYNPKLNIDRVYEIACG